MDLTVVCFTSNISDRGTLRVKNFLYSINNQEGVTVPPQVIIVDWSNDGSFKDINEYAKTYKALAIHAALQGDVWNKCISLNAGLNRVSTKFTMFTDIDYIFAPNFFSVVQKRMSSSRMLICRTHDSGKKEDFSSYTKDQFNEIKKRSKPHQRCGVGACQLAKTAWFREIGGYDERMQMWGVMDNDMVERAKRAGLEVKWIDKKTDIIHQWHKIRKKEAKKDKSKNVKIYRTDHTVKRNSGKIGQLPIKRVCDYR